MEIDLSFLPEGSFRIDSWADGVNADRYGSDYRKAKATASRATRLKVRLAEGGGFAARLVPMED
jgi:alpha-glucosidase